MHIFTCLTSTMLNIYHPICFSFSILLPIWFCTTVYVILTATPHPLCAA